MTFSYLIPMLESDDLLQTIQWYQQILGFELVDYMPDEQTPYWISLRCGEAKLMFSDRNAHSPHPSLVMTGVLYFYLDDVEALWGRIKDIVVVEWELQAFEYGMKEFGIRDCHGYLLSFGQSIE